MNSYLHIVVWSLPSIWTGWFFIAMNVRSEKALSASEQIYAFLLKWLKKSTELMPGYTDLQIVWMYAFLIGAQYFLRASIIFGRSLCSLAKRSTFQSLLSWSITWDKISGVSSCQSLNIDNYLLNLRVVVFIFVFFVKMGISSSRCLITARWMKNSSSS